MTSALIAKKAHFFNSWTFYLGELEVSRQLRLLIFGQDG